MEGIVEKKLLNPGEESILSGHCSQCGGVIHSGRELAMGDKQILCEGCYLVMVNPDTEGDVPSKWL